VPNPHRPLAAHPRPAAPVMKRSPVLPPPLAADSGWFRWTSRVSFDGADSSLGYGRGRAGPGLSIRVRPDDVSPQPSPLRCPRIRSGTFRSRRHMSDLGAAEGVVSGVLLSPPLISVVLRLIAALSTPSSRIISSSTRPREVFAGPALRGAGLPLHFGQSFDQFLDQRPDATLVIRVIGHCLSLALKAGVSACGRSRGRRRRARREWHPTVPRCPAVGEAPLNPDNFHRICRASPRPVTFDFDGSGGRI
jgi:hypothetical protein